MQKRAFIIHGWDGYPEEGWFPWLKSELEKRGFIVQVPTMPHAENPTIDDWVEHLTKLIGTPDENTYLVGHSIGCQTILRYLQSINNEIGGVVLVAGWLLRLTGDLSQEEIEIAKPWIETPIDYEKVKQSTKNIVCIFSDDDPFVLLKENKVEFETRLNAKTIVEFKKGHFSGSDGITELPRLLEELGKMSNGNN
ncbi:MAG: alpha/beta hydrolase [Patescibacteria group bacterium]